MPMVERGGVGVGMGKILLPPKNMISVKFHPFPITKAKVDDSF